MSEVANAEQLAAWDGDEGEHWSARRGALRHCDAAPTPGSWSTWPRSSRASRCSISGVAAGQRHATRHARPATVRRSGIDLSSQMLDIARRRAAEEGLDNVSFVHGDAQVHPFPPATFDVVISRFGAMFFADPVAAFANVGGAMRPGGRVALIAWQELSRNEWLTAIRDALAQGRDLPTPPSGMPGPFGFADADRVRIDPERGRLPRRADRRGRGAGPVRRRRGGRGTVFIKDLGMVRGLLQDLTPDEQAVASADLRAVMECARGH